MALSVVDILALFSTALLVLSPSNALSCGGTFDPWTNKGSIASPGYPNGYYDNSHCTWVIRPSSGYSIRLTFNAPFSLENRYDFVKIFETSPSGVRQQKESYSGDTVPPTYTSTTNRVEITFTSDGSNARQGFKLTWNRIIRSVSNATEGSITSPHYPNNYDDDSECTWIINAPSDRTISITFHPPFRLESNYDFLKIFETSPSGVRQQKESYSGDTVPPTYTSTTNRVEITFTSDGSNARQGFKLTWNRICHSVSNATEGSITSPHYPNNYDDDSECRWIINAPSDHTISITFHSPFHLEQRHDFLKIFETSPSGVRQQKESYSGDTVPPTYTSTTNRVEITFTSDGSNARQGFKLTWNRICHSVSNATEGSITSLHYPNNYDDDSECRWIINAPSDRTISITFHSPFRLESNYDFLKIFETSPSGVRQQKESYSGDTVPPTYTSTTNRVEITFTSDGSNARQGFKLTWNRICHSVSNATEGSITSPHYPNNYDDDSECRWIINAPSDHTISITFHSPFHLEQRHDFLKIFETSPSGVRQQKESYSGDTVPPTYTSTTNRVEITFTSDGSNARHGFKLTWKRLCGWTSNALHGSIMSPNYPNNYDNSSSCAWTIDVQSGNHITLTFQAPFYLEPDHAILKIFETDPRGTRQQKRSYSGNILPPIYTSTQNRMEITFTSDGDPVRHGFTLKWDTRPCGFTSHSSSGAIASPHYPNKYDNNRYCQWFINAPSGYRIKFTFDSRFNLENNSDFLKIFETSSSGSRVLKKSYSGYHSHPPIYTSTTNRVEVVFTSDSHGGFQDGFKMNWDRVEAACGFTSVSSNGSISSPYYQYYNMYCTWVIKASSDYVIRLTFHSPFNLELRYDVLKIFETSASGVRQQKQSYSGDTVPLTYTSTTNRVEITFTSDWSGVWKGFKLTWERVGRCNLDVQVDRWGPSPRIHSLLSDLTCTDGHERRHMCSYTFKAADRLAVDNPTQLCISGPFFLICYDNHNATIHVTSSAGAMEIGCSYALQQQLCAPPYEDLVATYEGNALCTSDMDKRIVRFLAVYQQDFHDKNNDAVNDDDNDDDDNDENDYLYSLFAIPVLALLIGCVYIGYRKKQGRNAIGIDESRESTPSEMSTMPSAPPLQERGPPPSYNSLFTVRGDHNIFQR